MNTKNATAPVACLFLYDTATYVRPATEAELNDSLKAAEHDGGVGVIVVDGVRCYVEW